MVSLTMTIDRIPKSENQYIEFKSGKVKTVKTIMTNSNWIKPE
jgi:hypothetical protein